MPAAPSDPPSDLPFDDDEPAEVADAATQFTGWLDAALYAPDALLRDEARQQLMQHLDKHAVALLIQLLDARHKTTRQRAARLLSQAPVPRTRAALEAALCDEAQPARLRVTIARLLSAQAGEVLPILAQGLRAADARVRQACATPAAPLEALLEALLDAQAEVSEQAAWALLDQAARVPHAVAQAAADRHGATGARARLLGQVAPDAPALAQAALAGDERALDHLSDAVSLQRLFESSTGEARAAAAWALARVGALSYQAQLDPDPAVRAAFARSRPSDDPALARLCADADPGVAWIARRAQAGEYAGDVLAERLGPHARSNAPSTQAPFGLQVGDPLPEVARAPAALALWQTAFDINLGVAVRSAEAAGLREVILVGRAALLRSSARGTDLALPVIALPDAPALVRYARARGYQLVAVQQTPSSVPYHTADYPPRPLFMLGAEGQGLPDRLRVEADLCVEIPMYGLIDSLNVAASATTVIFHWRVHHGA